MRSADHRIVYRVKHDSLLVPVVSVGDRAQGYERLRRGGWLGHADAVGGRGIVLMINGLARAWP